MKNYLNKIPVLIPALLIFNLLFLNHTCSAQWIKMSNGIGTGQTIYNLASNGNIIFAGTDYGVYLSTNNGENWSQTGLNFRIVYTLCVSNNTIYAGTDYGVFLSSNNGADWIQTVLNDKWILSLSAKENNIFAGTDSYGIYTSADYGTSWLQSDLNNQTVYSFAVSGNNVFAGVFNNNGVYVSANNGKNWTQTSLNNRTVSSLTVLANNLFAGTNYGIFLSSNNGLNWIQKGFNNQSILSLAAKENNIFTGTNNGVYLSKNFGTDWTQKNQGFNPIPSVKTLLSANNYIFAGTDGQSVWRRDYSEVIGVKQTSGIVPSSYLLMQNYPNPFNPATNIRYTLPGNCFVKLVVFDVLGREIETLVNEKLHAGIYEATFYASQFTSGIYFYRLTTENFSEIKKMILIK